MEDKNLCDVGKKCEKGSLLNKKGIKLWDRAVSLKCATKWK